MIEVAVLKWNKIHRDYKGKDESGRRQVFAGCIQRDGGTILLTEGIHFKIVKSKIKPVEDHDHCPGCGMKYTASRPACYCA